jgi:hypothetical protein
VEYKNYENIPNSAEGALKVFISDELIFFCLRRYTYIVIDTSVKQLCKSTEKGGKYYEFSRNTRKVKSTILHFQVRAATSLFRQSHITSCIFINMVAIKVLPESQLFLFNYQDDRNFFQS